MKNLNNYLLESLSDKDMIQYIQKELNNIDSKTLNKLYSILNDKQQMTSEKIKIIDEFFKNRAIDDVQKHIIRIFKDYDSWIKLRDLIFNKQGLPTSEEFLNQNNIYDLFKKLEFDIDMLKELATIRQARHSIARGPYEILCCLLLNDININNSAAPGTAGDVNTVLSGALEFKGDDARIKGQSTKSPDHIDDKFKELILNEYNYEVKIPEKGIFSSQAKIKSFFKDIKSNINIGDDKLCEIITKSIINQFTDDFNEYNKLHTFMSNHQKDFLKNGALNEKLMSRIFGVIDMHFYQLSERWDYMIIFKKGNKGDYIKLKGNDALDYEYMYNNKLIEFSGYPASGSPFGFAVHIHAI